MAITRAQQAKQMLQDGGRIGFKQGQSRRGGAPGGRRAGPVKALLKLRNEIYALTGS